ncbi:MAG: trigger factor [Xanthomonadales bacterium]|jgi:trigger factor|nr:trigger factor [Xanthomonadales bacterium]
MQVTIEETGALERLMKVQVPAEQIDTKMRERLQQLSRSVRLKGFRPGKVPLKVIQQRYGRQVRDEVTQEVMQNSLRDALAEQSLRVAALPSVTPDAADNEAGTFNFTAKVEVYPEVEDLGLNDINIKRPVVEITEQDVNDMIRTLQEQRRSWDDVERASAEGDRVFGEFTATLEDGTKVPEEGRQRIATVLGSGVAPQEIEDAMDGEKVDTTLELDLTFPESYSDQNLAGKAAKLELVVTKVQEGNVPEVDDEFAVFFGVEGGVDKLREEVQENLQRERDQAESQVLRRRFVDSLVGHFESLDLPPSLLAQEASILQQNALQQVQQAGGDASRVPSAEDFAPTARRRVLAGFLFGELAQRNNISLDQARVRATVERLASTYDDPQQVIDLYYKEQQLLQNVQQQVMEEQIVEWALEQISTEEENVQFAQLIREARNV